MSRCGATRLVMGAVCAAAMIVNGPVIAGDKAEDPILAKVAEKIEQVKAAIKGAQLDKAERSLRSTRRLARRDWEALNTVTYYQATVQAYRHDFEKAARTILARLPQAAKRKDHPQEFWFHNHLMMLRAAQGDFAGALLECYEMRTVGDRGTWKQPDRSRATQVQLKDFWHRALYLRLQAERVTGSQRQALLRYAEEARQAYGVVARQQSGFGDSIAVLDVIFAVHARDKRAALRAARRVDVAKNGDVEDLYLTFVGLLYGGDAKAARAVHEKMKNLPYVSHANAIMLMWADRDLAASSDAAHRASLTPLHPTAKPQGRRTHP